jgi:DNA-binding SARP family transcriptional activator
MALKQCVDRTDLVEIDMFGPTTCRVNGDEVWVQPILGSVLAAFCTRRRSWTPVLVLAELVWFGDCLPPTSTKTLHGHICRLRSKLGPQSIASRGSSYRLNFDVVNVDVVSFEVAVTEVERLHAFHDPVGVATQATRALALWRGQPYEEVDAVHVADDVRRLGQLKRRVEDLRAQALLDTGCFDQAIPDLEAAVLIDPLRETAWAHLMTALHESNRTAEALDAFGRARRSLAEQLGLQPSAALRILEARILRGERLGCPAPGVSAELPLLRTHSLHLPVWPSAVLPLSRV